MRPMPAAQKLRPIVLLTDFGLKDHYAGVLKGVILSIHPAAQIVDLSHGVEPQNILQAASLLEISYSFFPKNSIFVCVVDPGVGTSRKILGVKTKNYFFLGPDNGVLSMALARERPLEIRSVENKKFFAQKMPSTTFHGRDIISPGAAHLAKNPKVYAQLGPRLSKIHELKIPGVRRSKRRIEGEILFFDHFGNAITNIHRRIADEVFWRRAEIRVREMSLGNLRSTYGAGPRILTALFNSAAQLEIALPHGSARVAGSLEVGDSVILTVPP